MLHRGTKSDQRMTLDEVKELKKLHKSLKAADKSHGRPEQHTVKPSAESGGLTDVVLGHVEGFLKSQKKYFTNERDIQVRLALWLELQQNDDGTKFYDVVETEYGVPLRVLSNKDIGIEFPNKVDTRWTTPTSFPWHNNLNIDLVVCKNGQWVALELKYSTREIDELEAIFGEPTDLASTLVNQATANLAMYAYWKDVRRLEALAKRFENVVGGISVMVSNNSDCWNKPNDTSLYTDFSMHESTDGLHQVGDKVLNWKNGTSDSIARLHPSFRLDGIYPCQWKCTKITARTKGKNPQPFKFMITKITK